MRQVVMYTEVHLTFLPSPYISGNFKSSSTMVLYALNEIKQYT